LKQITPCGVLGDILTSYQSKAVESPWDRNNSTTTIEFQSQENQQDGPK